MKTTTTRARSFSGNDSQRGEVGLRSWHAPAARTQYVNRQRQQQTPQPQQPATRTPRAPKRWHSEDNSVLRTQVVEKLCTLFPALESANLNTPPAAAAAAATTASVVQRLEWMLYNAAHSRNEYANHCSLERRVQALVTQQLGTGQSQQSSPTASSTVSTGFTKPEPTEIAKSTPGCQRQSCAKRPRRASLSSLSFEDTAALAGRRFASFKRQRQESAVHGGDVSSFHFAARGLQAPAADISTDDTSSLFLNDALDLVSQVFQFLDGDEVLRARSVNRFLAAHSPSMVHSLTLDARRLSMQPSSVAGNRLTKLLIRCTNLRRLVVTNSRNANCTLSDLPRGYGVPVSNSRATQQIKQVHGYEILAQVTAAFHQNACLSLETLELRAPFEFATESDTILECLRSLALRSTSFSSGESPHKPATATLKHLILDSTFLGDVRVQQLATLLEISSPYFQSLQTLVLRGNFAGEAGCQSLFQSLHNCPRLEELDMSGNILTDIDAMALADALEHVDSALPVHGKLFLQPFSLLQKVTLHENYIGMDGFYALSSAICTRLLEMSDEEMDARGDDASLIQVRCERNCAPLKKASRLFLF
ncbi:Leucine-rich repeat, ribonuclease inhibitor subtype [Globisporangium polare]